MGGSNAKNEQEMRFLSGFFRVFERLAVKRCQILRGSKKVRKKLRFRKGPFFAEKLDILLKKRCFLEIPGGVPREIFLCKGDEF